MEMQEAEEAGILVLTPVGRVDSGTAKQFEERLMAPIEAGHTRVLVDFQSLAYISSAGLRVLLMAGKKLKPPAGSFALCGMQPHVREVFDVSGFATILVIHPDRPAALAAMG